MLSRHKTAVVIASWLRDQLGQARDRSIKDDSDGIAVYVDEVRMTDAMVFVKASVIDSADNRNDYEFCVKVEPEHKPHLDPTPAELAEIDDTP